MHPSAMKNCEYFFNTYAPSFEGQTPRIAEIGSQDVNGSLRDYAPATSDYIGLDFQKGKGVDLILTDPYQLPLESESVDIVLSSSCFEHSEFFWLTFLEAIRILKPKGLFYLNAPSNGDFHRHPVDCWRFYPDSGKAMQSWGRRNGYAHVTLLESFISNQGTEVWNDFVAVYLKDDRHLSAFPNRIVDTKPDFRNGIVHGQTEVLNRAAQSEETQKLRQIKSALSRIA